MEILSFFSFILGFISLFLYLFFQFRVAKKLQHSNPWMAFIPILNIIQFIKIAKCSLWWLILIFIPFINIIAIVWISMKFAFNLGERKSFGLLLILPPVNLWAMWKLGNKDATPTSEELESIKQIKKAIENNFPKESLKPEIIKSGISPEKADWLIRKALDPAQTKNWVIVLLAILEIPLFLLEMALVFFIPFASFLSSLEFTSQINMTKEIHISSNNIDKIENKDKSKDFASSTEKIDSVEKTDTPTYDKTLDLKTVKIELDTTLKKVIDSISAIPEIDDVKWLLKYKVENKTDAQIKIQTTISGGSSSSLSDKYIKAGETAELSIKSSIISGTTVLNGLLSLRFEISKCQGNCINDPQTIAEEVNQDIFISNSNSPKIVSKEEAEKLVKDLEEENKKEKEKPLFYKLKIVPDNEFIPIEKLIPKSGNSATRSLGIFIENNDNFPSNSLAGNTIDCKVNPNDGSPYDLSDTFFEKFSSNHSLVIKEFPEPITEKSGTITCDIKALCPVNEVDDDKSRKCPNKNATEQYKINVHTESFKYEISEIGKINISSDTQVSIQKEIKSGKKNKPKRRVRRPKKKEIVTESTNPTIDINNLPFIYNNSPSLNQKTTIKLSSDDDLGPIEWSIVLAPTDSNLKLIKSKDQKTITFTPTKTGDYKIVAKATKNNTKKETNFTVFPEFDFDESKIEGNNGSIPIDQLIGVISNQSWVSSNFSLSRNELQKTIEKYPLLTIVGYDPIQEFLIEYDDKKPATLEAIEKLKLEKGVDSVYNRVYEGENVPRDEYNLSEELN